MNKFEEFSQNMTTLQSEAWDWVVRLDSDEAITDREKTLFTEWLARSPAHIEEIRKLNDFWADTELTELVMPSKVGAENIKFKAAKKAQPSKTTINFWQPRYGLSFTLLLSVFFSVFWLTDKPIQLTQQTQHYQSPIGQYKQVVLADGSIATLNSNSQLKVSYSATERNLWLVKGAVHFEVNKDKQRPFNVYHNTGRVQAVGTAFTVELSQNDVDVLVTEGRIALGVASHTYMQTQLSQFFADDGKISEDLTETFMVEDVGFMNAGEFVHYDNALMALNARDVIAKTKQTLTQTEIDNKQAWQRGELVFTGESLSHVITQLKRYSTLEIEIADPQLADLKIGGRFTVDRLDMLFNNLEVNFGIEVRKIGSNKIIIMQMDKT